MARSGGKKAARAKNPAAVELGRLGGQAAADNMTEAARKKRAKAGGKARQAKARQKSRQSKDASVVRTR